VRLKFSNNLCTINAHSTKHSNIEVKASNDRKDYFYNSVAPMFVHRHRHIESSRTHH